MGISLKLIALIICCFAKTKQQEQGNRGEACNYGFASLSAVASQGERGWRASLPLSIR